MTECSVMRSNGAVLVVAGFACLLALSSCSADENDSTVVQRVTVTVPVPVPAPGGNTFLGSSPGAADGQCFGVPGQQVYDSADPDCLQEQLDAAEADARDATEQAEQDAWQAQMDAEQYQREVDRLTGQLDSAVSRCEGGDEWSCDRIDMYSNQLDNLQP